MPLLRTADGVRVAVRVSPRASRNAIAGISADSDGTPFVKVMVTAVAEGGKANAAVFKLLAKAWKLPKTSISLVSGATDRRKLLQIAGDPDLLTAKIGNAMEESGHG